MNEIRNKIIINKNNKLREIRKDIKTFLAVVETAREKKFMKDNVINLTMVYTPDNNDFEIFMDQVGGRLASFKPVNNGNSGLRRNRPKPKLKKRQAKTINECTEYFMERIQNAQKDRKIEAIILEHNFKRGVTEISIAYPAPGNHQ